MENINEVTEKDENVQDVQQTSLQTEEQKHNDIPQEKDKVKKQNIIMLIIKIVIAVIVIAVGTFLILYIVARAAKYESIGAMLQSMLIELEIMWQRVIY